jgi:hypothetical protein
MAVKSVPAEFANLPDEMTQGGSHFFDIGDVDLFDLYIVTRLYFEPYAYSDNFCVGEGRLNVFDSPVCGHFGAVAEKASLMVEERGRRLNQYFFLPV